MKHLRKTKYGDYHQAIRFSVFQDFVIWIVVTDDIHKSIAARYGENAAHQVGISLGMTIRAEQAACHIFIGHNAIYEPCVMAKVIAHEASHAVRNMFIWAGVCIEPLDSEINAYHLGYTVERATKFFQEVRDAQRKQAKRSGHSIKKCSKR